MKLPGAYDHNFLHLTLVSVVIKSWLYVESVTTSIGCSTLFDIETGYLSSLLQLWHKTFCNFIMLIQTRIQFITFVGLQFYNFLLSVSGHGVIFGFTSKHLDHFVSCHVCHPCDKRCILMWSTTFDTLVRYMLLEEAMYFNRGKFCSWLGRPFHFIVIKQRSSTYKSLGRIFNHIDDRIQGE